MAKIFCALMDMYAKKNRKGNKYRGKSENIG
jgi:hypothetical protein